MAIVKVIDMAIVLHGLVTASGTVSMGVAFVSYVGLRHENSPFRKGVITKMPHVVRPMQETPLSHTSSQPLLAVTARNGRLHLQPVREPRPQGAVFRPTNLWASWD